MKLNNTVKVILSPFLYEMRMKNKTKSCWVPVHWPASLVLIKERPSQELLESTSEAHFAYIYFHSVFLLWVSDADLHEPTSPEVPMKICLQRSQHIDLSEGN